MKGEFVLEVKNLNKSYRKKQVLDDVGFHIQSNEIVGFIGPNGAGKSTTMKCICNLIYPDSGEIFINGTDLFKDREKALSHQASLIESPGLYTDVSGRENIELIGKLRNISKERVEEICQFTELGEALERNVSGYSMGMKQRLGLGIAIMAKPKLLMLDEPSSGLDPTGIIHLRSTLQQLIEKEDISILFSSHQLGEVEKLADRIICINKGKIIETPKAFDEQFSYILQLDDVNRGHDLLKDWIDNVKVIGMDALRIELTEAEMLHKILTLLIKEGISIMDISKDTMDVETIYKEVYGE